MISCLPDFQSKLYARLNFILSQVANRFLMEEYTSGRVTIAMASAWVERWVAMGRAQFTEFNCGQPFQATILYECRDNAVFFGVYDRRLRDAVLSQWKINANSMAVLTLCNGDSAIQKHLQDSWKVLDLLGGGWDDYEALSKIHIAFHDMVAQAKKINERQGIPHEWNPPPVPKTPKEPPMRTPMLV